MTPRKTLRFSQAAIEALRNTPDFQKWNNDFENLKRTVERRVSPRDIQPLLRAGAKKEKLITFLAFVVRDSEGLPPGLMANRRFLAKLASDMEDVVNRATRVVNDPFSDGRFWWASEGLLSWDQVPPVGVIEVRVLEHMRAFTRLIRDRGEALARDSRELKKNVRRRGLFNLIAYVLICTKQNFDAEIAYLLEAAHRAAGLKKHFTADQIKKFRQRHIGALLDSSGDNPPIPSAPPGHRTQGLVRGDAIGQTENLRTANRGSSPQELTFKRDSSPPNFVILLSPGDARSSPILRAWTRSCSPSMKPHGRSVSASAALNI
jgi:hypothetical protein